MAFTCTDSNGLSAWDIKTNLDGSQYPACPSAATLVQVNDPSLQDVFAIPLASDLQSMWMTGFALPVILYLVAWAYQSAINFASKDKS